MNIKIPSLSDIVSIIKSMLPRTFWGYVAFVLMTAGTIAMILRFALGLGATTNLNDQFPWGLWIAFDFFGIGLAASGFTIVAAVHLFHARQYEPILRPAILTAWIGYSLVVLVLVIDLGRPLHFWSPLINWHHTSVMFEITWCLILYSIVLMLEFAPVILGKFNIKWPVKVIHKFTLPLVIAGVILSTLHQSSFGSLYLILPNRMHELWYSPLLPILFFISCISTGISMIIFETLLISRKGVELISDELKSNLAKIVAMVLAIYLVVRFQDMHTRGVLEAMHTLSYHSLAFYVEIGLGFVLPLILLLIPPIRKCRCGLYASIVFVFIGFAANRMNTVVTSLEEYGNKMWTYFPSAIEIIISLGIAALGITMFILTTRFLPVFETEKHE